MAAAFKKINVPIDTKIDDLWQSIWGSSTVAVCMKTGITEILFKNSLAIDEIAFSLKLNLKSTESVLRVLVAMGFAKERSKKFSLTEESKAYLVPSSGLYRGCQL